MRRRLKSGNAHLLRGLRDGTGKAAIVLVAPVEIECIHVLPLCSLVRATMAVHPLSPVLSGKDLVRGLLGAFTGAFRYTSIAKKRGKGVVMEGNVWGVATVLWPCFTPLHGCGAWSMLRVLSLIWDVCVAGDGRMKPGILQKI